MENFQLSRYLSLLVPSTIVMLLIWTVFIDGNLFYCSDKVFFLDFIPPFVHGEQTGDYFIVSSSLVWSTWIFFIVLIFISPFLFNKITGNQQKPATTD